MTGHSLPLNQAFDELWRVMADAYGLVPDLPFDAVMVRTGDDGNELFRAVPRLMTLMVSGSLTVDEATAAMDLIRVGVRPDDKWPAVLAVLDAWWFEALQSDPAEPDDASGSGDPVGLASAVAVPTVLGLIVRSDEPMVRWLHVWLNELDGAPAVHLADAVISGLDGPVWQGREDERDQVLAWARTEAVVNGLAFVAAPHLDADRLSKVLDRVLPG